MPEQNHQKIVRARTIEAEVAAGQMEDEAIRDMLAIYKRSLDSAFRSPASKRAGTWTRNRQLAVVNQLEKEVAAFSDKLAEPIIDGAARTGQYTVEQMEAILSWDDKTSINRVGNSAANLRSIAENAKVGDYLVDEWFKGTASSGWAEIKKEIAAGSLLGESMPSIVNRLRGVTGNKRTKDQLVNVARTWHAEVNSRARDIVYDNNKDIIEGVEWSAVLERPSAAGRGTCKRCQSLDGQEWMLKEPQPPCPLHPL